MTGDPIRPSILSVQYIPNADAALLEKMEVPNGWKSLGIVTMDSDDVGYTALDEATKKAVVRVVYAKSMFAGASNASTKLAGEFIGILAGPDPEEVKSGVAAMRELLEGDTCFYSAAEDDSVIYYAHCISRSGSYLSAQAGVREGTPIAYLIAPPNEAVCGLDAALKAADVKLSVYYGPPTETNFAGGLLTGEQSACMAACEAFAGKVIEIAGNPVSD